MEPEWMKQISSSTVCNFFYVFYVIYAVICTLLVITLIASVFYVKMNTPMSVAMMVNMVLTTGIATTMVLFHYLICDRALLTKKAAESM